MLELPLPLAAKRDELLGKLQSYESCAVAFSGGVDSVVVVKAAAIALGDSAIAVTGNSDALAAGELEEARSLAELIGIRHVVVETNELANTDYAANAPDRCYHCKTELYGRLREVAARLGVKALVNGANADDLGDYRPGMKAASENDVHSPLADCGFTKSDVRQLAEAWGLPVADKPATPCLSSRIAYGQAVTPERLAMIDQAEQLLRSLGFRELRVRYHGDDLARIEVPPDALSGLCQSVIREKILDEFGRLGFKFVTLDLAGFRSGSFRQLVPLEEFRRFATNRL
jgi:pyridinium-3,5-biscarboxylic acid mononucleotide sulfurtransferase